MIITIIVDETSYVCDEGAIRIYEYLNKRFDLGLNISDISIYEKLIDINDIRGENAVIIISQTTDTTSIYYDSSFVFTVYRRNKIISCLKSRYCAPYDIILDYYELVLGNILDKI